jgi:hypothetical protein
MPHRCNELAAAFAGALSGSIDRRIERESAPPGRSGRFLCSTLPDDLTGRITADLRGGTIANVELARPEPLIGDVGGKEVGQCEGSP